VHGRYNDLVPAAGDAVRRERDLALLGALAEERMSPVPVRVLALAAGQLEPRAASVIAEQEAALLP
jgi:hypothetical protein